MKALSFKNANPVEHIPPVTKLTLEELFEQAAQVGKLTTGHAFSGPHSAELKLHNVQGDYISIKSTEGLTLRENIAAVIERGRRIQALY